MRRLIALGLGLVVLAIPTAVFALGGTFNDDDQSIFEADIEWMADAGITKGCNLEGTRYCPDSEVTRGQMAAFLHRFAESGAANGLDRDRLYVAWERWNPEETNGGSASCDPGDVFIAGYAIEGPREPDINAYRLDRQGPIPVPEEAWTTPTSFANQPAVSGRSEVEFTGWAGFSEPSLDGTRSFVVLAYCLEQP